MTLVAWVGETIPKPSKVLHKYTIFRMETALVDEESIIKVSGTLYSWTFCQRIWVGRRACNRDASVSNSGR